MRLIIGAILVLVTFPAGAQAPASNQPPPTVTIGVLIDGNERRIREDLQIAAELDVLLSLDFVVEMPESKRVVGDFSIAGANSGLDTLLADPEVDLIIANGPIGSHAAIQRTNLSKPVVAVAILNADLQGAPREGLGSGVDNLNYIAIKGSEEMRVYNDIVPVVSLALLADAAIFDLAPNFGAAIEGELAEYGIDDVRLVPIGPNTNATVAAIPDDVEAVLMAPIFSISDAQFRALVDGITARGLPSYSWLGEVDVREGVLAGTLPMEFLDRAARRAALNIQRILLGDPASELPVDFPATSRLTINMATARAIGVDPGWRALTEAYLIDDDYVPAQTWSLEGAAREAVATNLEIRVQDQIVLAGAQNPEIANAFRLPQANAGLGLRFNDQTTARATNDLVPERFFAGTLSFSQIIWDDRTWAGVSIEDSLQEARIQDRESVKLNITLEASEAYLEVLRAKTLERVFRENLNLTRNNLELARVRVETGIATPQEIFRWENQIANDRRDVVDAQAAVRIQSIAFNRALNRPLEEDFGTADPDLDAPEVLADPDTFYDYLDSPSSFDILRDFLALESMLISPELQAIDAATRAQTRQLTATDRSFWSPTVAFDGSVQGFFARTELEEDFAAMMAATNDDYEPGSVTWGFGVNLTFPLFEGTARFAEQDQAREELGRLDFQRRVVSQQLDAAVRSALHAAQASYAGIELAQDAAEAARANYDLIAIQYQRGTSTILDLLDAQNISVNANEDAADALYRFLIDLARVQRAIGRFDFTMTAEQRTDFNNRLEEYSRQVRAQGAQQ